MARRTYTSSSGYTSAGQAECPTCRSLSEEKERLHEKIGQYKEIIKVNYLELNTNIIQSEYLVCYLITDVSLMWVHSCVRVQVKEAEWRRYSEDLEEEQNAIIKKLQMTITQLNQELRVCDCDVMVHVQFIDSS